MAVKGAKVERSQLTFLNAIQNGPPVPLTERTLRYILKTRTVNLNSSVLLKV